MADTSPSASMSAAADPVPVVCQPLSGDEVLALRDASWHVIGAATAEGVAVVLLLASLGMVDVTVHDSRPRSDLRRAFRTTHGALSRVEQDAVWEQLRPVLDRGRLGDDYLTGIDAPAAGAATAIVLGQGWYLDRSNRERVLAAIPPGAVVTSMTGLYLAFAPGPVVGVTGTNGKSTTVALADHLLTSAGVDHRTAGNERSNRQFLPGIESVPRGTISLLEVSNRQLMQVSSSPQVAAITSLTPDHLEEHGGFAGYTRVKQTIFRHQRPGDIAIANAGCERCLAAAACSPARQVRCGVDGDDLDAAGDGAAGTVAWRADGTLVARDVPLLDGTTLAGEHAVATGDDLTLPGTHNRRNAAVAVAVALACGAPPASIAPALHSFAGKSLRLEHVEQIDGVDVYSDIKATTPEATIAALDALAPQRTVLVAGGDDKGLDYTPLAEAIVANDAALVLVPGSATDRLAAALDALAPGRAPAVVQTLDEALDAAFATAAAGDAVIVSPAAAGFWTRHLQGGSSLRRILRRRRDEAEGHATARAGTGTQAAADARTDAPAPPNDTTHREAQTT